MASRADFERQALKHIDQLYYAALRIAGDLGDAEDLVQETYLKAYKAWPNMVEIRDCKAWLFKIMINTWNNERLRRSKEIYLSGGENSELALAESGHASGNSNPEAQTEIRLLAEAAERALRQIPEELRVLIHFADIEGFSYKEISDILSIPMGTVMSRLFRARNLLEKSMASFYPNPGSGSHD